MNELAVTVERTDAREWSDEQMGDLFSDGFPPFITADRLAKQYIGRVREWFPEWNLMLVDAQQNPAAGGWGVPVHWDGTVAGLPTGYTDAAIRAVEDREQGIATDTLVICGAVVAGRLRGRGLAGEILAVLRDAALEAGLTRVIAPVRPTLKQRYPLTPIETFMTWTRPDGTALDPWIRTHQRLGASILAAAPASQTMTGTVAEWEQWSGIALPSSGDYVIPAGLSVLHIDREADLGTYVEPNIWIRHR
jgi:GNAT superfamily N-acetyltransferase